MTDSRGTSETQSPRWYSIREASLYCGLPESTLRYYEQIGIIAPVARDPSSGHRCYSDDDLQALSITACLSATGMPLNQMRDYMEHRDEGGDGADHEVGLLREQQQRIERERHVLDIRADYVGLKIRYWQAVKTGDEEEAARIGRQAHDKIDELRR
ncbi:DNA-binding transcriptional regulator, MerR family [Bifidobacterium bohemicum]|uniref:Transcriptional regulator, MerR family n=1 Tax=Bifidobacterium bohemicum DSM 22767 TaxID=1437606 RepID=A0A086ZJC5_9BIFI|nr:MerR family transcriptional regulator [Bifidobacterium bohemicum]KFI46625.1 transcriptional regulator, MerR family [Bifidobacterium bohemicum DSM 22767]SCB77103.1 DNA-binding transcriptional regulator, MerR family [Bifidobacterium bohemicum]